MRTTTFLIEPDEPRREDSAVVLIDDPLAALCPASLSGGRIRQQLGECIGDLARRRAAHERQPGATTRSVATAADALRLLP